MKLLKNITYIAGIALLPFFAGNAIAQLEQTEQLNQKITRNANHQIMKGPSKYFTGDVLVKIFFWP